MLAKTMGDEIMSCLCNSLASSFFLDEAPLGFEQQLDTIKTGDWIQLRKCPICGCLWSIDVWDKLQWQVVIKLESENDLGNDSTVIRKELLFKARGGTSNDKCIWARCENKAIKDVVYCLEHLWETGARR